ncbi:hypothetical protein Hypma_005338 [Hypsizygus marmoreus]|uniref:Uncharacterized protein n=1 Tax=Hypsizygus marmoreus TaxID=39966 RepID=A0A369K256_HYPMA|nr:hypothetical protein Hypma_005338 [Hypsizygus marmoreus]
MEAQNHALLGALAQEKARNQKLSKRTTRLVHEKKVIRQELNKRTEVLRTCNTALSEEKSQLASMSKRHSEELCSLRTVSHEKLAIAQDTTALLRHENGLLMKCLDRGKTGVQTAHILKKQRTWCARKSGVYTAEARKLVRRISKAGCAEEKVSDVISACAEAMGIKVIGIVSRRTVGRAKKEGGIYGLMQLGHEISQADGTNPFFNIRITKNLLGFGESSDGTSHRQTTYESVHASILAPTYAADVDDSDRSTWTQQLHFVEVSPAIDHTAQSQFENSQRLADDITSAYSGSPLASRDSAKME